MKQYFRQILMFLITILFITFIAFLLLHFASSDPAEIRLARMGIAYTPEQLTALREEMGLNDPLPAQYIRWLNDLIHGDFGTSLYSNLPVKSEIFEALPNTLLLAAVTILISVIISLVLGVFCALHQDSLFDHIVLTGINILAALPGYFVAMMFLLVFALRLHMVPVIIRAVNLNTVILPACALAIGLIPDYVRQIRAIISDELRQPYVLGARSRGVKESRIFTRHIIRNSALPLLNIVGLSLGAMIGGSIIIENVFGWPGLGLLAMDAISNRDYTMLQGYVIFVAAAYYLINAAIDFMGELFNPQQKSRGEEI